MRIDYEQKLKNSLAESANMDGRQIAFCVVEYRIKAARTTPEQAFAEVLESYSNETIEQAINRMSSERVDLSRNARLEKLRSDIRNFEHRVNDVMQCEVVLSQAELDMMPKHLREQYQRADSTRKAGVHVTIPDSLKPKYESVAFRQGSLEITVES